MTEMTDEQLVAECLAGDDGAFGRIVERHLKPVFGFVRRLVGNHSDAEDVTQEAFVKAWKGVGKYRSGQNFRVWLYAVARNAAVDFLRRRRHASFSDFDDEDGSNALADSIADNAPLPDELAISSEDARLVAEAVNALPPQHQTILFLKHVDGLTFEEIGEVLGRPLNTVKSRYRRILAELRENLSKIFMR